MTLSPTLVAWIRRLVWTAAVLLTAIALFFVLENARANRAWQSVAEDCRRRGDKLDLQALAGPPVPDARNFFRAPIIATLTSPKPDAAKDLLPNAAIDDLNEIDVRGMPDVGALHTKLIRAGVLSAAKTLSPSEAVLEALNTKADTFEAFRAAARNRAQAALDPGAYMTAAFELQPLWLLAKMTALRATLELQTGRATDAYEDTLALTRLARRLSELRPLTLMDSLVALAIDGRVAAIVQLNSTTHSWSEPQLASLSGELGTIDWLSVYSDANWSECAWTIRVIDTASASELSQLKVPFSPSLIPGWRQQNKAAVARISELLLDVTRSYPGHIDTAALARLKDAETQLARSRSWYSNLARMIRRAEITTNYASDVDEVVETYTALAAERYFLRHHRYPDSLSELVTAGPLKEVPVSALTGLPIHYMVSHNGGRATLKPNATADTRRAIILGSAP